MIEPHSCDLCIQGFKYNTINVRKYINHHYEENQDWVMTRLLVVQWYSISQGLLELSVRRAWKEVPKDGAGVIFRTVS